MTFSSIRNATKPETLLSFKNRLLPSKYSINLDVSPLKKNYTGEITIDLILNKNLPDSPDSEGLATTFTIVLHTLKLISLKSVLFLDGTAFKLKSKLDAKAQTTEYSSDEIKFDDVLRATDVPKMKINFLGVVHEVLTFDQPTSGIFQTHYTNPKTGRSDLHILGSHCQPHFGREIFPCIDESNWKANIQLSLTIDNNYKCVSNMPVLTVEPQFSEKDGDRKTIIFEESPKMSVAVFSFALGDLDLLETETKMIDDEHFPLRIFTQVGESSRAQYALDIVQKYLPIVENRFGVKYPIPKLDVVALPFLFDGAVEDWSLIQVISQQILLPGWNSDDPKEIELIKKNIRLVLVHEMIHMYMGDYVTYDSYIHTWLNESFATFMATCLIQDTDDNNAWIDMINSELVKVQDAQRSKNNKPIFVSHVDTSNINNTFAREAYDKGIWLLRMLGFLFEDTDIKNYSFGTLFRMVGEFIKENAYGTFKPIDLWNFLKDHKLNKFKYDISTIMSSWIHTAGYPVISVSYDESKRVVVEQHRLLNSPSDATDIEDIPYQIPLFLKTKDGNLGRQMLTDRKLVLDTPNVFFVNYNDTAFVTVKYSLEFYRMLAENLEKLTEVEQIQLFEDIAVLLSTNTNNSDVVLGLLETVKGIKKIKHFSKKALIIAATELTNLAQAVSSYSYFKDKNLYQKILKFLDQIESRWLSQLQWDDLSSIDETEAELRRLLMSLNYQNGTAAKIAKKLYKKLMHGPKNSIPKELLLPIFALVQTSASSKEFKEIFKLIKSPGLVVQNIIQPASSYDVQIAAVNSLGFVTARDLRNKTLNFVSTNFDIAMIEFAVIGFRLQPDFYDELWSWFNLHFRTIYSRAAREKDGKFTKFFNAVTEMIFESCLHDDRLSEEVTTFVKNQNVEVVNNCFNSANEKFENIKLLNGSNDELKEYLV